MVIYRFIVVLSKTQKAIQYILYSILSVGHSAWNPLNKKQVKIFIGFLFNTKTIFF